MVNFLHFSKLSFSIFLIPAGRMMSLRLLQPSNVWVPISVTLFGALHISRCNSVWLECLLWEQDAAGSSPVTSTTFRTVFNRPFFAPHAPETLINRAFVSIQLQMIPMGVARKCHLGK